MNYIHNGWFNTDLTVQLLHNNVHWLFITGYGNTIPVWDAYNSQNHCNRFIHNEGTTCRIQALTLSWNKPLKASVIGSFSDWVVNGQGSTIPKVILVLFVKWFMWLDGKGVEVVK